MIVSDSGAHCVVAFNDKGQVMFEYGGSEGGNAPGELDNPAGICTDKIGNVIICDTNNDRVVLIDPKGHFLCNIIEGSENIERPSGVCINNNGHLVVAQEDGRVKVFSYLQEK